MEMAMFVRGAAAAASTGAVGVSSPYFSRNSKPIFSSPILVLKIYKAGRYRRIISCSAVQESTPSTSKETKVVRKVEEGEAPVKLKPPAKAAVKPLPELMEEDVIPSLKSILEAQNDISDIDLYFKDNRLEGSFLKMGNPYAFWAFFPGGSLTGPKGFSLSCYGSRASTIEPFLGDEKKITARHIVFWVEKRLAAQGLIPVWKE